MRVCEQLHAYTHHESGSPAPLLTREFIDNVRTHHLELQRAIDYNRDYDYDYFAIQTLQVDPSLLQTNHICSLSVLSEATCSE